MMTAVVTVLLAQMVCLPLKRADGHPLPERIAVVSRPHFPESTGACLGHTEIGCAFDDAEVLAPLRLRAARAMQPLGCATIADGGICLPPGMNPSNVLLRFVEGDWDPSRELIPIARRLEVHADGELLVTPANVIGATDGGFWSHEFFDDPLTVSELTVVPSDRGRAAQVLVFDTWSRLNRDPLRQPPSEATKLVMVDPKPRLPPVAVEVRGAVASVPLTVLLHGWTGVMIDGNVWTNTRVINGKKVTGLRSEARYVLEARQGDRRAVASIDATTPRAVLDLQPQAQVHVTVVDQFGKPVTIETVDVHETDDSGDECPDYREGWQHSRLSKPRVSVVVNTPPGPHRCLRVRWSMDAPTFGGTVSAPAPLKSGRSELRMSVERDGVR